MTIEQMKERKTELGYTNEKIAELSGVPLGTVQKVFAGVTKAPRYDTIQKLQKVLGFYAEYNLQDEEQTGVAETGYAYIGISSPDLRKRKKKNGEKKPLPIKKRKIKLGMFEGKYKMPPDELLYGDDLSDLFDDV
ncbi:MAG: helix-turn-helix domain-containing protein [Mogibacterium sp.]|nr:helix-turn-helix domain-containing protein [Mogibacterium sp.]